LKGILTFAKQDREDPSQPIRTSLQKLEQSLHVATEKQDIKEPKGSLPGGMRDHSSSVNGNDTNYATILTVTTDMPPERLAPSGNSWSVLEENGTTQIEERKPSEVPGGLDLTQRRNFPIQKTMSYPNNFEVFFPHSCLWVCTVANKPLLDPS